MIETNVSYSQGRELLPGKEKEGSWLSGALHLLDTMLGFSQQPYKVYVREEHVTQRG